MEKDKKTNNGRKKRGLALLLLLVMLISIGYATLSSNLFINGTSKVTAETWDVHFTNLSGITKTGLAADSGETGLSAATIDASNNKLVTFNVKMRQPGDTYTFDVDVKNFGTLPAKANLTVTGLDGTAADYLTWTVTGLGTDEAIAPNASKTLTVTVQYKTSVETLPAQEFTANLAAEVSAVQS